MKHAGPRRKQQAVGRLCCTALPSSNHFHTVTAPSSDDETQTHTRTHKNSVTSQTWVMKVQNLSGTWRLSTGDIRYGNPTGTNDAAVQQLHRPHGLNGVGCPISEGLAVQMPLRPSPWSWPCARHLTRNCSQWGWQWPAWHRPPIGAWMHLWKGEWERKVL